MAGKRGPPSSGQEEAQSSFASYTSTPLASSSRQTATRSSGNGSRSSARLAARAEKVLSTTRSSRIRKATRIIPSLHFQHASSRHDNPPTRYYGDHIPTRRNAGPRRTVRREIKTEDETLYGTYQIGSPSSPRHFDEPSSSMHGYGISDNGTMPDYASTRMTAIKPDPTPYYSNPDQRSMHSEGTMPFIKQEDDADTVQPATIKQEEGATTSIFGGTGPFSDRVDDFGKKHGYVVYVPWHPDRQQRLEGDVICTRTRIRLGDQSLPIALRERVETSLHRAIAKEIHAAVEEYGEYERRDWGSGQLHDYQQDGSETAKLVSPWASVHLHARIKNLLATKEAQQIARQFMGMSMEDVTNENQPPVGIVGGQY